MSVALRLLRPPVLLTPVLLTAILCGVALAGAGLASPAKAQDRPAVFAGATASDDLSGYVGALVPLPGAQPQQGWALRPIVSAGSYDYRSGGADIDADYVNLEVSAVHRRSGAWGYANLGVGVRYSNTDLSRSDPGNRREGEQWDALISADGARYAGAWRAVGFASYAVDIRDYYVRGELTRQIGPSAGSSGPRLGAEAILEGDPTFDRQSLGLVVAFQAAGGTELRLSAGARTGDGDTRAYAAIGLSRAF